MNKKSVLNDPRVTSGTQSSFVNKNAYSVVINGDNSNVAGPVDGDQHGSLSYNFSITNESTRFAQTRYPFPPFIIRFSAGKVKINQVKEGLIEHCKKIHDFDVHIINCRASNGILPNNEYDILIFSKDVSSFSFLLDKAHWPEAFGNEKYDFSSYPAIPPQLCLLVKNVDLLIDFDEFCDDIKSRYPHIKNVIRMKNKFQNPIKLIKLELTSADTRNELLNKKKININHISYDVIEYLAPANVLICSKCMALGHFKKQCVQVKETCRTCGELADDMKSHKCSLIEKCIHCNQNHKSTSLKCPVVKSFRAELTRKILHLNKQPVPVAAILSNNFDFNSTNFPHLPHAFSTTSTVNNFNNSMMVKLDDLIGKLSEVKEHLVKLEVKHDKVEKFIVEKNKNDELVKENFNTLSNMHLNLKKDVVQLNIFVNRHENMFIKLLIPMFEDLFTVIASQNKDKNGNTLDADLKCKLNRYLIQMKKASEGKQFN